MDVLIFGVVGAFFGAPILWRYFLSPEARIMRKLSNAPTTTLQSATDGQVVVAVGKVRHDDQQRLQLTAILTASANTASKQ